MLALLAQGRPLHYWGPSVPVIAPGVHETRPEVARVTQIHADLEDGDAFLRFVLDRAVREAMSLRDGTPVSGRLQISLYIDVDDDPETGRTGPVDEQRRGADRLIEVSTLYVGADEEEEREAQARVLITIDALDARGRRERLWAGDHVDLPDRISLRGDSVEARLPRSGTGLEPGSRLVYATGDSVFEGWMR